MKKNFIIILWFFCFLLPSCISIKNYKKLKERIVNLEVKNAILKERYKEINLVDIKYSGCLSDLRQYKQRLINCDSKLRICFGRGRRKR